VRGSRPNDPCCADSKTGSTDARSEWTTPRIIEVAQVCEVAAKLKEVVTQDSEAAEVVDMGPVEGSEVEVGTILEISSSIHKEMALVVSRATVETLGHKASNESELENQAVCRTYHWMGLLPSALHGYPFKRLAFQHCAMAASVVAQTVTSFAKSSLLHFFLLFCAAYPLCM